MMTLLGYLENIWMPDRYQQVVYKIFDGGEKGVYKMDGETLVVWSFVYIHREKVIG